MREELMREEEMREEEMREEEMTNLPRKSRRDFLRHSTGMVAGVTLAPLALSSDIGRAAESSEDAINAGRIYTSVKWGMIADPGTVLDKFQLCREIGFDGMELISPTEGFSTTEVLEAARQTQMPVHGVVDMKHWEIRLSSPNPEERSQGVAILEQALRDCQACGGFSVLLVPGRVNGTEESHEQVWKRSIEEIRKVLPIASHLGVRVLIENVWNGFCETPEQLRDYVDEIASPWVGVYFDIGNVRKFGPSEDWIRLLGHRIVKLDVKDWSASSGFCKIGDGDVNWPEVRKALAEIEFTGWCTAEVEGGGREQLTDIKDRMNRVLQL